MKLQHSPNFHLYSPAFSSGDEIPQKYTCEGSNLSPPLSWTGFPQSTRSFALVVEDPDAPDPEAPGRPFVHWLLFNIAPTVMSLEEGMSKPPEGARMGKNDFGEIGFGGACPPEGRHRYVHRIYALDDYLELPGGAEKEELERSMEGHILGVADLIGLYEKRKAA